MRHAVSTALAAMLGASHVQAQVTYSVCNATNNSSVTCGNVTFQIDLSSPGAKSFVVSYLDRAIARTVNEQQKSRAQAAAAIQAQWQQEKLEPILRRLDLLERDNEKEGALADRIGADHDHELEVLGAMLDQVLGLKGETEQLKADMARLDKRVQKLETKGYLVDSHRLLPEVRLLTEPTGAETREWLGAGLDYRFPGRLVIAPGFSYLRLLSLKTHATVTEGDPDHVPLVTFENVDARGNAIELSLLLGWEFRVFTPYVGLAARHAWLTYRVDGVQDQEWASWELPVNVGGDLRLVAGLSIFGCVGAVFSPARWSREYEYDLAGQQLTPSPRSIPDRSWSFQGGVRYALGI